MNTQECINGHKMTGMGSDQCPECEAPWKTKPSSKILWACPYCKKEITAKTGEIKELMSICRDLHQITGKKPSLNWDKTPTK